MRAPVFIDGTKPLRIFDLPSCGTGRTYASWMIEDSVRQAGLLMILAFALRLADFGNAALDLDEQWYLLVGDRLLRGATPYLDLWDRKPIGLFLLYAAIRWLPGDGILAYQLVATIFAASTAVVVAAIARGIGARSAGALVGGVLYLLTLSVIGGRGGQSPVFYNLPVALAALLTVRLPALVDAGETELVGRNGVLACALIGIAMQFKYTAACEGVMVGGAHVWAARSIRRGLPSTAVASWTAAWALVGLAPTLVASAGYLAIGRAAFSEFWFANFVSIFLRQGYPPPQVLGNLASVAIQCAPLLAGAMVALRAVRSSPDRRRERTLVVAWLSAAALGFVAIGTFHDHYALPLIAPLASLSAVAVGNSLSLLIVTTAGAAVVFVADRAIAPDVDLPVRQAARLVREWSIGGCPYVFMGDPIIYHLAASCIPTSRAFPNTLAQSIEAGSSGIDEASEVERVMAARPPVVVSSDRRRTLWNRRSQAVVHRILRRDYRLARRIQRGRWNLLLFVRRGALAE